VSGREEFTVHVDGRALTAYDGDTIAAVLWRDGRRAWRRTRGAGQPRGLFCGIGACYDCLVSVDGVSGVRACVAPAFADAYVSTHLATSGDDESGANDADEPRDRADG
jgi:predicted molibdopterin-dependent oxidoreductase YjgC